MIKIRVEYEEILCPFCDKGKIICGHVPSSLSVKRMTIANVSKTKRQYNADVWLIKSGCSVCGKSQEDVEKELKKKGII